MVITGEAIDLGSILSEVGQVGLWLQAIGIAVIVVIIFDIISFFLNRKRLKKINSMHQDIFRIEKKLDRLLRRKK